MAKMRRGRIREERGELKSFNELPVEIQEQYKEIAKEVKVRGIDKVYVYGSYHHGWYDEMSDLDVTIVQKEFPLSISEFRELMKSKGINGDIRFGCSIADEKYILIPE